MGLTRKDFGATVVAALAVLVYLANRGAWDVPLIGDSNRWAIVALGFVGMVGCSTGARPLDAQGKAFRNLLGALGGASVVLFVIGLIGGAQWPLTWMAIVVVALWAGTTLRHALYPPAPAQPAGG